VSRRLLKSASVAPRGPQLSRSVSQTLGERMRAHVGRALVLVLLLHDPIAASVGRESDDGLPGLVPASDLDPLPHIGAVGSPCSDPNLVLRSCGTDEFEISGRAVFVTSRGESRPVHRLTVFRPSFRLDGPEVVARVPRSGSFKFSAHLPYSAVTSCVDGVVRSSNEWASRDYLLKSPGCQDLTIAVSGEWKPHDVVMKCPSLAQ